MTDTTLLGNVPDDKTFVFSNGKIAHNLEELYSIIKESDVSIFTEHVNDQKNDFANWIKYCIFHIDLANNLYGAKDKETFLKVLNDEIVRLKNSSVPNSQNVQPQISQPTPAQSQPVPQDQVAVQPQVQPIVQPQASPQVIIQNPEIVPVLEQRFDFEDIFQQLIDELEKEIITGEL